MYSDNGRNFVGNNNEIKNIPKIFKYKSEEDAENYTASRGIKRHFNSSSMPHFDRL